MAIKAKKLKSEKGIKKSLSGGSNKFAQRVPEEGITVRFLTEPEEWWEVEVHFGDKTSFPCNGDDGCLGCDEGFDVSRKWYANVFLPEEDRVAVFEMGKTVVESVMRPYERNHTVTDRDFEISKEGTGLRTKYFVDALDPTRIKGLDKMETIEMEGFFEEWLKRAMREEGGEEEITATTRRRTKPSSRRKVIEEDEYEDDEIDDEDEEDEEPAPRRKRPVKSSAQKRPVKSSTKKPARRRPRR